MKSLRNIFLICAFFLAAACSKELPMESVPSGNGYSVSLSAGMPAEVESRAGFDAEGGFFWSADDRIGVTTEVSQEVFHPLALISGTGQKQAVFEGTVPAPLAGYALYPYHPEHRVDNGKIDFVFPASYTYDEVDEDFFTAEPGKGNSFNPPMWGRIESGQVMMKHLGGVFCIKLEELPVGEDLMLELSSEMRMNGHFEARFRDKEPSLEAVWGSNVSDEDHKAVIHFKNTEAARSGVFYFPAAVGRYDELQIRLFNGKDKVLEKFLGKYTVHRRSLKRIIIADKPSVKPDPGTDPDPDPVPDGDWSNRTCWVGGVSNPALDQWGYAFILQTGDGPYKIPGLEWDPSYGWYDCNKLFGTAGDDNLCWAATASNLIYWWLDRNRANIARYGKYKGPAVYNSSTDCEVFQFFKDNFINDGNWITQGINWFFSGVRPGEGLKAGSDHPGFLPDVLKRTPVRIGSGAAFSEDLKYAFTHDEAIGLIVDVRAGRGRHAITVWGADFDENGEVRGIYIAENNDVEMERDPYVPSPMQPGKLCRVGLFYRKVQKQPGGVYYMESGSPNQFTIPIYEVDYLGTHQKEWQDYFRSLEP